MKQASLRRKGTQSWHIEELHKNANWIHFLNWYSTLLSPLCWQTMQTYMPAAELQAKISLMQYSHARCLGEDTLYNGHHTTCMHRICWATSKSVSVTHQTGSKLSWLGNCVHLNPPDLSENLWTLRFTFCSHLHWSKCCHFTGKFKHKHIIVFAQESHLSTHCYKQLMWT